MFDDLAFRVSSVDVGEVFLRVAKGVETDGELGVYDSKLEDLVLRVDCPCMVVMLIEVYI